MTNIKHQENQKKRPYKSIFISLSGLSLSAVLIFAGFNMFNTLNDLKSSWHNYTESAIKRTEILSELQTQLGYGGLIHNFKNYILRQDESRITTIEANFHAIDSLIFQYQQLAINEKEKQYLYDILQVTQNYKGKFEFAKHLIKTQKILPNKLDKLITVNDKPALNALAQLSASIREHRDIIKKHSDDKVATMQSILYMSALIIPLIVAYSCFLVLFIKKLTKATKEISEARNYLDNQLEGAPDAMISVNEQGIIARINRQAEQIFGYSRAEIVGQPLEIIIPHRHKQQHKLYRLAYFEVPKLRPMGIGKRLSAIDKNGREFAVEVNLNHITQGNERFAIATIRDVQERKEADLKLLASEANLKQTIASLPVAIMLLDKKQHKIMYLNLMFENMLGYSLKDLPDFERWMQKAYPDKQYREHVNDKWFANQSAGKILDSMQDSAYASFDQTWDTQCADGTIKTLNFKLVPLKEQDLIAITDLTNEINARQSLLKSKEAAEQANKSKGDFLANMSHEIRTPMNAIMGMSYLALRTDLNEQQRDYLSKIQYSSNTLLAIINDILDMSKVEAGQLELEIIPFSLSDILDHLTTIISMNIHSKDVEVLYDVNPDIPHHLVGDPLRLGQVLINLVNNAIKFTHKGEVIVKVEVQDMTEDNITMLFTVKDTGIGMSKKQLGTLFQPFKQADTSTTRKYGGTGLGLVISKNIAQLMQGNITVDSVLDVGSCFSFIACLGIQKTVNQSDLSSQDIKALKCLIVDDNPIARSLFSEMLSSFHFDAKAVESGEAAIEELHRTETAKESAYDVVLMDYRMPNENGLSVSRRIKSDTETTSTPMIIMITAHDRSFLEEQIKDAPIDGLLVKPISASVMLNTLLSTNQQGQLPTIQALEGSAESYDKQHYQGFRFLLVEDNLTNQEIALSILTDAGALVDIADNGLIAIEKLQSQEHDYDLILMDIQMPEMDGYKATEFIRHNLPEYIDTPILAMTANAMKGDKEQCLNIGMNAHIAKPIDVANMFTTIDQFIDTEKNDSNSSNKHSTAPNNQSQDYNWPGINVKLGLSRLAGKETILKKGICNFFNEHQKFSELMEKSLHDHDWKELKQLAHQLKGAAGNIAAEKIQYTAVEIEQVLLQQRYRDLSQLILNLPALFAQIEQTVMLLQAENEGKQDIKHNSNTLSGSELQILINRLKQQLSNSDMEAESLCQQLSSSLKHQPELDAPLEQISNQINALEYDQALTLLTQLEEKINGK